MVAFLAILEANASTPTLENRKLLAYTKTAFPPHDWSLGKNDFPYLDAEKVTTIDKKRGSTSGMTESNGQED